MAHEYCHGPVPRPRCVYRLKHRYQRYLVDSDRAPYHPGPLLASQVEIRHGGYYRPDSRCHHYRRGLCPYRSGNFPLYHRGVFDDCRIFSKRYDCCLRSNQGEFEPLPPAQFRRDYERQHQRNVEQNPPDVHNDTDRRYCPVCPGRRRDP